MKIPDIIKEKELSISFEFFPPKTEQGERTLFDSIEKLSSFDPSYVSVTYGAGGSTREKTISIVERIKKNTSHTVIPHLTCIGSGKEEIREILDKYESMGIENILALRGDPPMGVTEIPQVEDGLDYAKDLISFIKSNYGFSMGAAVYPEGHRESSTLEADLLYTREKANAGADFFITQMFFDNTFFYSFLERTGKLGIDIPIIPGIMPVTNLKKIRQLAIMCNASIPSKLNELIYMYENSPEDSRKAGIDFTAEQCRNLKENGVKYFHFYTLNLWEVSSEIINKFQEPC